MSLGTIRRIIGRLRKARHQPSRARRESNIWLQATCGDVHGKVLSIGSGDDSDGEGKKYHEYFPTHRPTLHPRLRQDFPPISFLTCNRCLRYPMVRLTVCSAAECSNTWRIFTWASPRSHECSGRMECSCSVSRSGKQFICPPMIIGALRSLVSVTCSQARIKSRNLLRLIFLLQPFQLHTGSRRGKEKDETEGTSFPRPRPTAKRRWGRKIGAEYDQASSERRATLPD